jgi:hypothetical protein
MAIGIEFEVAAPTAEVASNRMDVGCFIGFARARGATLPQFARRFLLDQGLLGVPGARAEAELAGLLHVPVPITSFASYEACFESGEAGTELGYLAAAVRSFFAQGGRKCFVIRAGDPLPLGAPRAQRLAASAELLGDVPGATPPSPLDPHGWRGLRHLHGLDQVSFVCFPDLPALVAHAPIAAEPEIEAPPVPEYFVECSPPPAATLSTPISPLRAPRVADESGYLDWASRLHVAIEFLRRFRKDVQLIASIPLPLEGTPASIDLLGALSALGLFDAHDASSRALGSAFLQLAYPWLGWEGSASLPEGLEGPEGVVAGLLARRALSRGTFASAAGQPLYHVTSAYPELSVAQRTRPQPLTSSRELPRRALEERVSLLGPTLLGFVLSSDVTTSPDGDWRPAGNNRLMSVWVRALRELGLSLVFESSNEGKWAELRRRVAFIGDSLFRQGALRGPSARDAYEVLCDRSTMTPQDVDQGRIIAEVLYRPALPIESIRIALALSETERVSVSAEARA